MVTLDSLVPKDHLLRLIDQHLSFDFIRAECESLYCPNNGRPALDPVMLFKMLFVGYLFGVRSERRLIKDIEVNVAYRWFVGLRLTDPVPDASTFSQNRRRRFAGTDIEQRIFDGIVSRSGPYAAVLQMSQALEGSDAAPIRHLREQEEWQAEDLNRLLLRMLSELKLGMPQSAS